MSDQDNEVRRTDDSIPTDPGESLQVLYADYVEAQARASEAGGLLLQECLEGLVAVFNRVENLPETLADIKRTLRQINTRLDEIWTTLARRGAAQDQFLEQMSAPNREHANDARGEAQRETGEPSR